MRFFKEIIKLLQKDGINSKKEVIDILNNLSISALIELRRQINEEINFRMKGIDK
jgi:hypothetical protein